MKPIKMLGLAALAALLAMAFVGASSASAETTRLCSGDPEGAACEAITHVHETTLSGAKGTLLNGVSNVLCDVLFLGEVTAEGSPLEIKGNFSYSNCVDEKPNSCTVTEVSESSTIKVLKEGHETASVVGEGEVKVVCSGISCTYNGKELLGTGKGPLLSEEENGSVSITEQTTNKVKGLLCPATAKLDITVTGLLPTYLSSGLMYCVEYQHAGHGYYLNNTCTESHATREGNYALVVAEGGLGVNEHVCVELDSKAGLYKEVVEGECKTDDETNTSSYELGKIVQVQ